LVWHPPATEGQTPTDNWACLQADVETLWWRWQDLEGCPPLAAGGRFPGWAVAHDALTFAGGYHCQLRAVAPFYLHREAEVRAALAETEALCQTWDALRDAQCGTYYVSVRRQALARLRERLGEEAWALGAMPCPVPVWRWEEIR